MRSRLHCPRGVPFSSNSFMAAPRLFSCCKRLYGPLRLGICGFGSRTCGEIKKLECSFFQLSSPLRASGCGSNFQLSLNLPLILPSSQPQAVNGYDCSSVLKKRKKKMKKHKLRKWRKRMKSLRRKLGKI
uniref:Small ribosomal subunit protein mS38 n=1 Tax=Amphimedon queenslandica TaxID=400682 RepID=A0A1X7VH56_AMPQE